MKEAEAATAGRSRR